MKIMARSKLKTNTGSGTPGSHDFKCKLPKNITLSGINTALYHIQKNHLDQAVLKDDYIEYVVNELCSIYPNLSTNICRHYCITSIENSGKFQTDVEICSDVITLIRRIVQISSLFKMALTTILTHTPKVLI